MAAGDRIMERPGYSTPAEQAAWESLRERVTIFLRPIGSPTALGLLGLAAASLILSGLQLDWVAQSESGNVALVLVAFSFTAQLLACLLSFLARDGAAATAMGLLALTWLVVGLVMLSSEPGSTSDTLGLFLLFSGTALAMSALTAAASKLVIGSIFCLAAARFGAAGLYHLTAGETWADISGVIGLVLVTSAMYAAWAGELEDAQGKTVLPLGRRGMGQTAMHGSLLEQVKHAPTEAGVRKQL